MKKQAKWYIDIDKAIRFNKAVRDLGLKPNETMEELLDMYVDYIAPKLRESK